VPAGGPFRDVTAGVSHTCGVKTDGSVACWGRNVEGQTTAPPGNGW
jgi:alpha-tubulin suppressor-like RCC1 family protein